MKLYPKILKNILTIGFGLLFAFQSYSQVEEVQPDSILQAYLRSRPQDSIPKKKEQEYLEAPVHYPARDSIIYSYSDNKIRMYGEAKVTFKDIELQADYIEMTMDRKEVYARGVEDSTGQIVGKPKFKDGDEEFDVTSLRYNFGTKRAWVTDAVTKMDQGGSPSFLNSHITKRDSAGNLHIKDGEFTTCDATDPHWYFAITKGIMTSKKSVISGPAYLVIEGIPIYFLGLPFGFFPKQEKKASGIIMPKMGEEANRGFYLRDFGYYFAGKEKFDLTLQGDIYSKGSWRSSVSSRYKQRYKYNGNLGFTFAKNVIGESDIDNNPASKDFSVRWSHNQDPKAHPYRTFGASVNFSNSAFDQRNTYDAEQRMSSTKSSSITFSRRFPNNLYNFTAKVGATQNSQNKMVTLNLPSGTFSVNRFYPFKRKIRVGKQKWYEKIDMRYTSSFENQVRSPDSTLFQSDIVDRMKNGFKHEVPLQASFKLIPNMTLTPSLRYEGSLYLYYIEKEWDPIEEEILINRINQLKYAQTLAPNLNLTYNPRIYGFYDFRKGKIKTIRHVATPSVSFNYRPDIGIDDSRYYDSVQRSINGDEVRYSIFDESLYRLPSVSGRAGSASFRIGNNLEMKVVDKADTTGQLKKVKILDDLSLTTNYDVFRDSLNFSPINLSARTRILNNVDIKFSSTLDPYAFEIDTTGSKPRGYTVNRFELTKTGKPVRMTSANFTMGFSLPIKKSPAGGGSTPKKAAPDIGSGPEDFNTPPGSDFDDDYWEYDMPWRLNVNYSFRYSKPYIESTITQSINFRGDFSLTPNWKFDFSSGYDFVEGEITYTRIGITRKLHCWQMTLDLIPFGQYKSYTFQINVVSNMFKDVKFRKAKSWYDNF